MKVARAPRDQIVHVVRAPSPAPAARFVRFAVVGGAGYAANLAIFGALVRLVGVHYAVAATASFTAAATLNYILNRWWTFRDARGSFVGQGWRCLATGLAALGCNLLVLHLLVRLGADQLIAQSFAVLAALPLNFLGNRFWAFSPGRRRASATDVYAPRPGPELVRTAVCIPTYDERENLEPMLLELAGLLGPNDVVVVIDDASPDGTGELADRLADELGFVHVLHRPGKDGLGRAYVEGLRYALDLGAEYVLEMDCDFSHPPADLLRLIDAARRSGLAVGSRYIDGGSAPGLERNRLLLSRVGSTYARRLLGLRIRDLTGGFKCYRRDALESVRLEEVASNGYAFQIETTYRAARAGFQPVEVPIEFGARAGGASKMSFPIAFEALWRVPVMRITAERVSAYRTIAIWWATSRILVVGTALLVQAIRWPRASWYPSVARDPLALLGAWDGRWYRMVAERGYLVIPQHESDTAFFPLYPLLLRGLGAVGLSLNTGGLLLANLGLLVGLVALYELARTWIPETTALRAAVYAAVFPVGYVFSMVYPEGLVLAAMAFAGLFAARNRWGTATVAAACAAFARPEALLLVLPLGSLVRHRWRALSDRQRGRALMAVAAAPAAVAGVSLYDWRTFGDPLAFSSAQHAWGRTFSPEGVRRAVIELSHGWGSSNVWLIRDAAFCALYILLLLAARRAGVPNGWVLAGALIVLLPLETGSFTSDARFGLLALPVYVGLAAVARRPWIDRLLRGGSLVLLTTAAATILMRWP